MPQAEETQLLAEMPVAEMERAIEALERFTQPERLGRLQDVLNKRTAHLCTVFENPSNPNNVWAALRTIDSFGIQNVHVIADPELYIKKGRLLTMSSAMGSQKWLSLHGHDSAADCARALKARGYRIIGSSLGPGAVPMDAIDWSARRVAVAFGNEKTGLSEGLLAQCDQTFYIPMRGFAESFNVSVALSIVLASAAAGGGLRGGDLGEGERRAVYLRWLLRTVAAGESVLQREGIALPQSMSLRRTEEGIAGFSTLRT
ncbi:Alpha/beta knot methyltransferase [Tribonema minus]|uniref:Alpha/beta knot methyltransferase n=1 Tax=Tribonema minus TaxID=303371 RepID=A0A836C8H0_9STRA|nr:Alpha/beta knot methyltransferase [Tribonema minus]